MTKLSAWCLAIAGLAATLLVSSPADALLVEKANATDAPSRFTYFYPYRTSYTDVSDNYAFDDDPLRALVHQPYTLPISIKRVTERRSMVAPRVSFVQEMYKSTEVF